MNISLDQARVDIKIGKYGVAPAGALSDPILLPRVQGFRRQLGARMMALDKIGMHKRIPQGDYHISIKIDGEFTVLAFDGENAITLNPGGTVRQGLPLHAEAASLLKKAGISSAFIAGELYVNRPDGKRPRVHDVVRVARRPETAEDLNTLCFGIFDIIEWEGEDANKEYAKVWEQINTVFKDGKLTHPVKTTLGSNSKDIGSLFEEHVVEGTEEGIVARSDTSGMFKIKPRHTLDVAVIGFAEGSDDRSGMLHDLLLAIMRTDGSFHIVGRVGGGFADEQRIDFLADLQDEVVESEYAEVNSDRVAYQMIEPQRVAEISCLDLVSQTTRGGTIDRMILNWNTEDRKWETVRRMPLVSIISPQFVRFREDKDCEPSDIAIAQLTNLVQIPLADKPAEDLRLPASEVLRRKVGTKVLKGNTMVRKLLMWKTNKEEQSSDYPAYVIHVTDYSPNRKEPLQRDIRVSDCREQMDTLWEELEKKSFVKGWNEVVNPNA